MCVRLYTSPATSTCTLPFDSPGARGRAGQYIECQPHAWLCDRCLHTPSHLILLTAHAINDYPRVTDEDSEAQGHTGVSSRSSTKAQASNSWASQTGQSGLRGSEQEELESLACRRGHSTAILIPSVDQGPVEGGTGPRSPGLWLVTCY